MVDENSESEQWWKKIACFKIFFRRESAAKPVNIPLDPENYETLDGDTRNRTHGFTVNSLKIPRTKYGELVKLGYNGGNFDRKSSRYVLLQRFESNGLKISKQYESSSNASKKDDAQTCGAHSITYVLSDSSIIVEYKNDSETDMFQIGRSNSTYIDFHVSNILPGNAKKPKLAFSSRYGCRILVERTGKMTAKLFAGGFETDRNLFLGESATTWCDDGKMDGVTTNGVLIMNPKRDYSSGKIECGEWRECSVGGQLLNLRKSRFVAERTENILYETNVLRDGALIDLCGVTLIWRSAEGMKNVPTKNDIEEKMVGLNTLLIPKERSFTGPVTKPYYFLRCGHLQLYKFLEQDKSLEERRCTVCLMTGPVLVLSIGREPAFYVDSEPPTFAFNPCGHMASECTVQYWASVRIPNERPSDGANDFKFVCPFCRTNLSDPRYIQIQF